MTLFTPHLGSAVDRVRLEIAMQCADDIAAVLAGRRPRYPINEPSSGRASLAS
jgi:phosphonate dehydrogenase